MNSVSVFPTEIYEHIIDSVGQWRRSRKTLHSCSLTCWTWVPRSRLNLFRYISFASTGSEGIHRFARLLDEATHLRSLVQEVKISMGDHPVGAGPQSREALEILPILLCGRLPTLRTFRLSAVNRHSLPLSLHSSFFPSLAQFRTVTTLVLYHVTFARSADFVRTVVSLPRLKTLECGHVDWLTQHGHLFDTLSVSHLSLDGANYYSEASQDIRARTVISLLSATRLRLTNLMIDGCEFSSISTAEGHHSDILLPPCPHLHLLRINLVLEPARQTNVTSICSMLADVTLPALRVLVFNIEAVKSPLKPHELQAIVEEFLESIGIVLDGVLSAKRFPVLQRVVFHIGGSPRRPDHEWWLFRIRNWFPLCCKDNKVRLTCAQPKPDSCRWSYPTFHQYLEFTPGRSQQGVVDPAMLGFAF